MSLIEIVNMSLLFWPVWNYTYLTGRICPFWYINFFLPILEIKIENYTKIEKKPSFYITINNIYKLIKFYWKVKV